MAGTRWPDFFTESQEDYIASLERDGWPLDAARAHAELVWHLATLPQPAETFQVRYGVVPEPSVHLSQKRQKQLDKTGVLHCTQCRVPLPGTMAYIVGRVVLCERCWGEIAQLYTESFPG